MTLICSRHDCEQELIKIRKQVENLKKDLAVNLKKIKTVETTLQTNQEEFEILQVCS
jgi:hydrogenase maturation factor HypF (carbamoyltransferase family)